MHTVAVVVYDRCLAFETVVPCEVFGIDRSGMAVPNYRLMLCRVEPGPLRVIVGFTIDVPYDLAALEEADTVIVPGWRDIEETPPEALLQAVRRAHARGARIVSLCSGAFVLAAAGLLDGRRATTHWMYAEALAARFPRIRVDADVLYVGDGQVFTAAGTAAAIDLCLHLVALDYGQAVANTFARRMVVAPHRDGGQAQYIQAPKSEEAAGGSLAATAAWALGRLQEPLTVRCLADHAGVPVRTFARQFRLAIGTTPGRWLTGQRILAARRALEATEASIEQIAQECGFGSAGSFRLHFRRALGIAPTAYRRQFQERAG